MAHCQIANQQQMQSAHQAAHQFAYRHTPHHAAQLLQCVPNAPRKVNQRVLLDLTPICTVAEFAAEIEDAQDPVTPLHVPRMEPPKLNKRR